MPMDRLGPLRPRGCPAHRITASPAHRGSGAERRVRGHPGRKAELGRAEEGQPRGRQPQTAEARLQLLPAWPWPGASSQALCLTPFVQL